MNPPRDMELPSERVAADMRRRIKAGEFGPPGHQLPTTAKIAEMYGVSRATSSKAMATLAGEGLVISRPRWGLFRAL